MHSLQLQEGGPGIPPVVLGGILPPAPQPTNYRDKYLLPSEDVFQGNYTNLYNEYSVRVSTPMDLRTALYRDGNTGTPLHILLHVRSLNAPQGDPGAIIAYNRLTRHDAHFGQQATAYDNIGIAFFGDTIGGQAPLTVQLPDALFNQLPVVQIPTQARLAQLLVTEPDTQLFGPYMGNDPDVEVHTTCQAMVVSNKYVVPFLNAGMTPREAYTLIHGMVQQEGNGVACGPLLDWLRVAITRCEANGYPRTLGCHKTSTHL